MIGSSVKCVTDVPEQIVRRPQTALVVSSPFTEAHCQESLNQVKLKFEHILLSIIQNRKDLYTTIHYDVGKKKSVNGGNVSSCIKRVGRVNKMSLYWNSTCLD